MQDKYSLLRKTTIKWFSILIKFSIIEENCPRYYGDYSMENYRWRDYFLTSNSWFVDSVNLCLRLHWDYLSRNLVFCYYATASINWIKVISVLSPNMILPTQSGSYFWITHTPIVTISASNQYGFPHISDWRLKHNFLKSASDAIWILRNIPSKLSDLGFWYRFLAL